MTTYTKSKLFLAAALSGLLIADLWYDIAWYLYLLPFLLFVIFLVVGTTTLSANVFTKSYTQPQFSDNKVAITFDDGPDQNTIKVLETLKQHGVKATFFCIGHKIERHPEIMKLIVEGGHAVGNHSYSHSNYFPLFSKKKLRIELQKTSAIIEDYTGQVCQLFRPPFGVINPKVAQAAIDTDHKIIGWNLRSFDTSRDYKKVLKKVKNRLKSGTVLLLHDDRDNTNKVLDEILLHGKSKGFTFVTVDEIFKINE